MITVLRSDVDVATPPTLIAASFTVNGFSLPQVDFVRDSAGTEGFRAFSVKDDGGRFAWAELLSGKSPEDAVARLASEIRRNRS